MPLAERAGAGARTLGTSYDDLPARAAGLRALLARGEHVVLELGPPGCADLGVLEVLAGLVLAARRSGQGRLHVRADRGLRGLAGLCGLAGLLDGAPAGGRTAVPGASGEPRRQPQPGEQLRPEEVVDVGDPPA